MWPAVAKLKKATMRLCPNETSSGRACFRVRVNCPKLSKADARPTKFAHITKKGESECGEMRIQLAARPPSESQLNYSRIKTNGFRLYARLA